MAAFAHMPSIISRPRLLQLSTSLNRAFSTPAPAHQPAHLQIRCDQAEPTARVKVAAVIVGNEILNGKTLDTNLNTLAKYIDANGASLEQSVTIRDDINIIAKTVREMSSKHDLVFTSGGIGPTLDDVTYAGVAAAFSLPLARHEETIRRMGNVQPDMDLNPARLRMAQLPAVCETLWTDGLWVPLAVVRNVYILPGIPRLFNQMLMSVPIHRFGSAIPRCRVVVFCEMAEGDLAELLLQVDEQFDAIGLGSYPATTDEARNQYRTMIIVEGDHKHEVLDAAEVVRAGVNGRYENASPPVSL